MNVDASVRRSMGHVAAVASKRDRRRKERDRGELA
jgi:hypothetical protein